MASRVVGGVLDPVHWLVFFSDANIMSNIPQYFKSRGEACRYAMHSAENPEEESARRLVNNGAKDFKHLGNVIRLWQNENN
jgi:hypothetical protein